jgi:DNA-binding GntR family transcriptional regulator
MTTLHFSSQKIYAQLRQKILEFELYPGTRITESELAARFGVSRTPVRAALQRLELEGHITIMPKQGCFVRPVDIEKISYYYDVRISLEATAIEQACEHMNRDELDTLCEIWNPATVKKTVNMDEVKMLEEAFHIAIAVGSGNPVLANYLRDINNHIRILRQLGFPDRQAVLETYEEHFALCEMIKAGNVRLARKTMIEHIRKSQSIARSVTLTQLQQAVRKGQAASRETTSKSPPKRSK